MRLLSDIKLPEKRLCAPYTVAKDAPTLFELIFYTILMSYVFITLLEFRQLYPKICKIQNLQDTLHPLFLS